MQTALQLAAKWQLLPRCPAAHGWSCDGRPRLPSSKQRLMRRSERRRMQQSALYQRLCP